MLRGSHRRLRLEPIRSPAAPPRMAIRGGAFLSEHANDSHIRYYRLVSSILAVVANPNSNVHVTEA